VGAILGHHSVQFGRQAAGRSREFRVGAFAHRHQTDVQRLDLGHGQVQGGQGDRCGDAVADATLAGDGHAGCGQNLHIAVNRAQRHVQGRGEVGSLVQLPVAQGLDQ
jgi:hypothetical protein